MSLRINGGKEIADAMKKYRHLAEPQIEKAITITSLKIERDAKKNAPVLTGALRRSITKGRLQKEGRNVLSRVGTNLVYARRREFENLRNPQKKYYMKKSFENNKAFFAKEMSRAIDKVIDQLKKL